MAERGNDEFYVGYLPQAPGTVARRVRQAVVVVFGVALAAASIFVTRQKLFDPSVYEYGVEREFTGLIRAEPYPSLLVLRPGTRAGRPTHSSYLLVAVGKHGVHDWAAELNGQPVRLRGSLIYHDGRTMIEVVKGSAEKLTGDEAQAFRVIDARDVEALGEITVVGEIVDSKCWLGVMKPARLKPHRACATRCISGGIPPLLLVEDEQGRTLHFLLAGADHRPLHSEVLHLIAEPVEITGRVARHGDWLVLHADPATYKRVEP